MLSEITCDKCSALNLVGIKGEKWEAAFGLGFCLVA